MGVRGEGEELAGGVARVVAREGGTAVVVGEVEEERWGAGMEGARGVATEAAMVAVMEAGMVVGVAVEMAVAVAAVREAVTAEVKAEETAEEVQEEDWVVRSSGAAPG